MNRYAMTPTQTADHPAAVSPAPERASPPDPAISGWHTLLVPLDRASEHHPYRAFASALARAQGARLVGLVNVPPLGLGPGYEGAASARIALQMHTSQCDDAQALGRAFAEVTRAQQVACEVEFDQSSAVAALLRHACAADLIVAPQPRPEGGGQFDEATLVDLLMQGGRPVLLVPFAGRFERPPERVLIAWTPTAASNRAVALALPLLRAARQVDLLTVRPRDDGGGGGHSTGGILAFLARHGVPASVHDEVSDIDAGSALLSRAADLGSDLIVMGCYGHSRFREQLAGGVTRTLLRSMTVPVLMAH